MSSVVNHWTQNLEEFHRSPKTFLAARNITAHSFVLDILEVSNKNINYSFILLPTGTGVKYWLVGSLGRKRISNSPLTFRLPWFNF